MSAEDQLAEDDRIAAMKMLVALTLYRRREPMSHDHYIILPMILRWNHPAARLCIDESLKFVAEPHETEVGKTDWRMRDSAHGWLDSDMVMPANSDDRPMFNISYLELLLHSADNDSNLQGKCVRLWERMSREIA